MALLQFILEQMECLKYPAVKSHHHHKSKVFFKIKTKIFISNTCSFTRITLKSKRWVLGFDVGFFLN